ncbi:hypothetical protein J1N10_11235 [Carboxylicivirga sp. A043]|uniref:DUF6599 family protein n=1 Tax=Carboxylicivirga litoralis TaxID=2816963 RepID=UPI0021CB70DB|nr:DUF6599 family protein [Carboxylicivirga sp. A043]MCU4156550.1 hypothetical protein [Carboxylicivirga sp. A043]
MKPIMILLFFTILHGLSASEPFKQFPEIEHWQLGEIDHYTPNTLYNAINGGSELYLKFNFKGMTTVDYQHNSNYITVELYKHASPIDAFGIYSMERPQDDKYFNIGVQGFGEDDYIYFLAGQYYIKVRALKVSNESKKAMKSIAQKLSEQLNNNTVYPCEFNSFPESYRVPFSDKYIKESILGYEFLKHSYEVKYSNADSEYTLFVLKGDNDTDAKNMLSEYMTETNSEAPIKDNTYYVLADRYTGNIGIIKAGQYLICSRGTISKEISQQQLEHIAKQLKQL